MKTSNAWWVVAGEFRLLCQTKESAQEWIYFIVHNGGVPTVESAQ